MEDAPGAKEKREVDRRRKTHGELCRTLLRDVSDAYAETFPSYEQLGTALKQHASSKSLGLSKSTVSVLLQMSDTLDELATMQAVRAGEIRNIANVMQKFDGGIHEHQSACTTVMNFIDDEFKSNVDTYTKAQQEHDKAAKVLEEKHLGPSKKTHLDLEKQKYSDAKQALAQNMHWLDHQHAASLKRGIGDLVYSEMGLHCRAMQMHAALFPITDEIWPDTSRLTGWVERGHWVDGWIHNFLKATSPEVHTAQIAAGSSGELVEKQIVPYWARAGTAAGSYGAPNGCSLVSIRPRISWLSEIELDPPDLGWYYRNLTGGEKLKVGEEKNEIRQVVNRRGAFDRGSKTMGCEYKVRYVNADDPDAWVPEDQNGLLALRLSLQKNICKAWVDQRAALVDRINTARGNGQGVESLQRELLIHDKDAWQTVAGWAANKGASIASLPPREIVERYARDREARGKNRGISS